MAGSTSKKERDDDDDAPFELCAEKELLRALKEKEPTFDKINRLLDEFRTGCQDAIFQSFEITAQRGATTTTTTTGQGKKRDGKVKEKGKGDDALLPPSAWEIEERLWNVHLKINARFRKILSHIRDDETRGKKRPVERRKLLKRYSSFLGSSKGFYEGYIRHLLSDFNSGGSIAELDMVAEMKNLDTEILPQRPQTTMNEKLRQGILISCHSSLIKLGDLSRYYQTELVDAKKKKTWDLAIENYTLASLVNPDSGTSHNQLAVISLAEGDHLQVIYNLYRALLARKPYPTAKANLEIEFKKILSSWNKGESLVKDEHKTLISSFVYLHAQCYKGVELPENDHDLENEILRQMTVDLKENSLSTPLLQTFCLINIAAEAHARAQAAKEESNESNAQLYFRQLNVKSFFTLLQILLAELDSTEKTKVTSVAGCILPVLRDYSSWLLVNSQSLVSVSDIKDTPLYVQIKEFWKIYASALTLLTSSFDVPKLPELNYLLREDERVLGFDPLVSEATVRRYRDNQGAVKSRFLPQKSRRTREDEMLFRIREFVIDGLDLVVHEKVPVIMVDDDDGSKLFVYKEEGLPLSSPPSHGHTLSSTSIDREDIQNQLPPANPSIVDDRTSVSAAMNRMVDNLVESEPADSVPNNYDDPWRNTNSYPVAPMPSVGNTPANNGLGGGANMRQSYSPGPPLPSIMNTPFAPQPGEAISPSSRPSTAVPIESPQFLAHDGNGHLNYPPLPSPYSHQLPLFQQQQIQSTPIEDFTSSLSPMHTPRLGNAQPGFTSQRMQPSHYIGLNSRQTQIPSSSLSYQFSSSPRNSGVSTTRNVGVIGQQTPPCGQGG